MTQTERDVLVAVYDATGGGEWILKTNWKTGADLSQCYGVKVNNQGRVVGLSLRGNDLTGMSRFYSTDRALLAREVMDLAQEFADRQQQWRFQYIASEPQVAIWLRLDKHTFPRGHLVLAPLVCKICRRTSAVFAMLLHSSKLMDSSIQPILG